MQRRGFLASFLAGLAALLGLGKARASPLQCRDDLREAGAVSTSSPEYLPYPSPGPGDIIRVPVGQQPDAVCALHRKTTGGCWEQVRMGKLKIGDCFRYEGQDTIWEAVDDPYMTRRGTWGVIATIASNQSL